MQRRLTATEARLARLIARGSSDAQVAAELGIDQATIEHQLAHVYQKLAVRSRTELALLIEPKEEELL